MTLPDAPGSEPDVIVGQPHSRGGAHRRRSGGRRNLILAAGLALLSVVAVLVWQVAGASWPQATGAGIGPSPTGMPDGTAGPSMSASPAAVGPSGTPAQTPSAARTSTAPRSNRSCSNPTFTTSDRNGGWSTNGYYVHNNMWNNSVPLGPETLYACAFNNWYVVSNQTNNAGAVKTYPNVHKDYRDAPISSFSSITSTFAASSPRTGIYNVAYDIWINGIASRGSTEIMIWTENYKQVPAGSKTQRVTLSGKTYDVWKTGDNHYIAFVPTAVMTSGSINLLEIFKWITGQGWLAANSTLGQICYGVEIVSTNGKNETFTFTDFSITSK